MLKRLIIFGLVAVLVSFGVATCAAVASPSKTIRVEPLYIYRGQPGDVFDHTYATVDVGGREGLGITYFTARHEISWLGFHFRRIVNVRFVVESQSSSESTFCIYLQKGQVDRELGCLYLSRGSQREGPGVRK